MTLRLSACLASLIGLLALGCGADSDSASDRAVATGALLTSGDFAADVRKRPSVVSEAPCPPQPYLGGAETTESATFEAGSSSTQQVIGVFPTTDKARAAFDSLGSASRKGCIMGALNLYSSQQAEAGSTTKPLPPNSLDVGEEARTLPFVIDQPRSVDLRVDVVLIRVDRVVTDLLFLTESATLPTTLIRDTSRQATARLTAALDQPS